MILTTGASIPAGLIVYNEKYKRKIKAFFNFLNPFLFGLLLVLLVVVLVVVCGGGLILLLLLLQ